MKLNKIKSVKICGINHEVQYLVDHFDANATHLGEIDYKRAIIKINDCAYSEIQSESLWHEIIHAILVHIGYDELSSDEDFVSRLAMALNSLEIQKREEWKIDLSEEE